MDYLYECRSLIGNIIILSNGEYVYDIITENNPNYKTINYSEYVQKADEAIIQMKKWLDLYFIGIQPDFEPPYKGNKFDK